MKEFKSKGVYLARWNVVYRVLRKGAPKQSPDMGTIEFCPVTKKWHFVAVTSKTYTYRAYDLRGIANVLDQVNELSKS